MLTLTIVESILRAPNRMLTNKTTKQGGGEVFFLRHGIPGKREREKHVSIHL